MVASDEWIDGASLVVVAEHYYNKRVVHSGETGVAVAAAGVAIVAEYKLVPASSFAVGQQHLQQRIHSHLDDTYCYHLPLLDIVE